MCSKHMLEIMYNEPQLLLVYRVALEIEMVYGLQNNADDGDNGQDNQIVPGDYITALGEANPVSPVPPNSDDPADEGTSFFCR